jgi:hypothetical protein
MSTGESTTSTSDPISSTLPATSKVALDSTTSLGSTITSSIAKTTSKVSVLVNAVTTSNGRTT